MKAVVVQADKTVKVEEKQKPVIGNDEILVKVAVVGQNPTDWKHAAFLSPPGVIIGCDYAGTVVESKSSEVHVGDRVSGFVHGGKFQDSGAFAEFVKTPYDMVYKIPDNLTFEQAASVPVPAFTAVQAIHNRLGLPEPGDAAAYGKVSGSFLVWSGATAVGQYAIQLAKLAGFKVYTTASKENHELVKSLGADEAFDYRDAEVVEKLKKASGDSIEYGIDCISEEESVTKAINSFSSSKGGKLVVLLQPKSRPRSDVTVIGTLLYTAAGKEFTMMGHTFPAVPADRAHHVHFEPIISDLLKSGKLRTMPTRTMPNGLDGVQAGFEEMKAGKVKAEKLVYRVSSD